MILDTVVEVKHPNDIDVALRILKRKPVVVVFRSRELFNLYEPTLRKQYILYTITDMTDKEVTVLLVIPENFLKLDKRIEEKSYYLANPEVISYTIRVSDLEKTVYVKTPLELAKLITRECQYGYTLLVLRSRDHISTSYIICQGNTINAVVYKDTVVVLGKRGLRMTFYRGPYTVMCFKIKPRRIK